MRTESTFRSPVRPVERWALHAVLVLEQVLGARLGECSLGRIKAKLRQRIESRLAALPRPSPVAVERRENLDPEEFHEKYFRPGRPVIFAGAARDWPCVRNWNLDYFSAEFGANDVLLVNAAGLTCRTEKDGYEFLSLRELVGNIQADGEKYLRFSPLLHENPALAEDLDLSWLDRMRGGRTFARTYYMFIGGPGRRTHLHNDQPCNLYVQVCGEKKWTLFSPLESALLYPKAGNTAYVRSEVNLSAPDPLQHPLFPHAQPFTAHLRAGDVLYVPPFMWHEVENLTETIAVGYRYSSIAAALRSSTAFALLRVLSMNPPFWKTMSYGKQDTNLIWAHGAGFVKEVLEERARRRNARVTELAGK